MNDDDKIPAREELFNKLKKMDEEELWHYRNAGKSVTRICAILGISLCFFVLTAPGMLFTFITTAGIVLLARVSQSADETVAMVDKSLERFNR